MDKTELYTKRIKNVMIISWRCVVRGLVKCMQNKFIVGPAGSVAMKCYYALVGVLDSLYERPAVLEHTGEAGQGGDCQDLTQYSGK